MFTLTIDLRMHADKMSGSSAGLPLVPMADETLRTSGVKKVPMRFLINLVGGCPASVTAASSCFGVITTPYPSTSSTDFGSTCELLATQSRCMHWHMYYLKHAVTYTSNMWIHN